MPTADRVQLQRQERRAIVALFAVFALLMQMFVPMAALANSNSFGADVICTAHGASSGSASQSTPSAPAHQHDAGGCDHCVCPVAAAPPPPLTAAFTVMVLYASTTEHAGLGADDCVPGRGLAAPPPPSRGPPISMI